MAVVPVIFTGVFYPKNKKDPPLVGTFMGNAAIAGLEVGGGPIIPPEGEKPPDIIWGPPGPWIGWWVPGAPGAPDYRPPEEFPEPPQGGVKPFPPEGGWGYSDRTGWVFKPGEGQAGPKR